MRTVHLSRVLYVILGCVMVVLGIVGVVLPIMPTVPFLLVASWCFSRSSPRFHYMLHHHKVFGSLIKKWEQEGSIPLGAKIGAVISMMGSFILFWVIARPSLWFLLSVLAIFFVIFTYIVTRPSSSKV